MWLSLWLNAIYWYCRRRQQPKHSSVLSQGLPDIKVTPPNDYTSCTTRKTSANVSHEEDEKKHVENCSPDNREEEEGPYDFDNISTCTDKRLSSTSSAYAVVDLNKGVLGGMKYGTNVTLSNRSIASAEDGEYDVLRVAIENRKRKKNADTYEQVDLGTKDGDVDDEYSHCEHFVKCDREHDNEKDTNAIYDHASLHSLKGSSGDISKSNSSLNDFRTNIHLKRSAPTLTLPTTTGIPVTKSVNSERKKFKTL